jgi:hypothetical protein
MQMTLEFFCTILARDAEGTQLPYASLREEVLSIFEQDPLIELILTGVEILKNSINFKSRGLSDLGRHQNFKIIV